MENIYKKKRIVKLLCLFKYENCSNYEWNRHNRCKPRNMFVYTLSCANRICRLLSSVSYCRPFLFSQGDFNPSKWAIPATFNIPHFFFFFVVCRLKHHHHFLPSTTKEMQQRDCVTINSLWRPESFCRILLFFLKKKKKLFRLFLRLV